MKNWFKIIGLKISRELEYYYFTKDFNSFCNQEEYDQGMLEIKTRYKIKIDKV
jgi:hypothetical protein